MGCTVLVGDPGRAYLPTHGFEEIARYRVPAIGDVEAEAVRSVAVLRVVRCDPM